MYLHAVSVKVVTGTMLNTHPNPAIAHLSAQECPAFQLLVPHPHHLEHPIKICVLYNYYHANGINSDNSSITNAKTITKVNAVGIVKGVMTRSMVAALSEWCSPFLKGGNSAFIAAIASDLFRQTEYRSLE